MLKERVITAILLIVISVFGFFVLPLGWYFVAFAAFVISLAAYEWNKMAKLSILYNAVWIGVLLAIVLANWINWDYFTTTGWEYFIGKTMVFWLLLFLALYFYPNKAEYLKIKWLRVLMGLFLLGITFLSLIYVKSLGNIYLVFIAILVILADTGAFFAGRKFGKHKLAPSLSPGKTWEGLAGALITNTIFVLIFAHFYRDDLHIFQADNNFVLALYWLVMAWSITILSAIGDLFESMIKRVSQVKDSSNLLPGHGGVLDRLDSFSAALPAFVICLYLFG